MASLRLQNLVATGDLATQINYSEVLDCIDLPHLRYDPDIHQGLELRFIEEGPLVTVYATGKYIIRAPSMNDLQGTRQDFLELFSEKGLIDEASDKTFEINNIVGSGDIEREVDLEALAEDLDLDEITYDPGSFPALRANMEQYKGTVLLYRSGKVIVTGADSVEGAEAIYNGFREKVNSLFARTEK